MQNSAVSTSVSFLSSFYARCALVFLAIGIIGFAPSYWLPLISGKASFTPLIHGHAAALYSWQLLFLLQTSLIVNRRPDLHRRMGMASIGLALVMLYVGQAAAVDTIHKLDASGMSYEGRSFSIISFTSIWMFSGFFAAAIYHVRRPEIHKRFMLAASIGILNAPIGRVFRFLFAPEVRPDAAIPPPPMLATLPLAMIVDGFLLFAMIRDYRTRGSVHPVYWWIGSIMVGLHILRIPLSQTQAWHRLVGLLAGLPA